MNKIIENIEQLVAQVAKAAVSGSLDVTQKLDALKLLTPYYAVLKRQKGRQDESPSAEDEPSMGELRQRLRLVEQDKAEDDGKLAAPTRRSRKPI